MTFSKEKPIVIPGPRGKAVGTRITAPKPEGPTLPGTRAGVPKAGVTVTR